MHIAEAAGWLAGSVALLALILGFFLPEPKLLPEEAAEEVFRPPCKTRAPPRPHNFHF